MRLIALIIGGLIAGTTVPAAAAQEIQGQLAITRTLTKQRVVLPAYTLRGVSPHKHDAAPSAINEWQRVVIYLESDARYKWQYPVMTPRFFAGSTDITQAMERGMQWTWEPVSGNTTIKVKVTIVPRWIPREGASFTIWATSAHNPQKTDVVEVWALKNR